MGRKKIYLEPPRVVKIQAADKRRIRLFAGRFSLEREQDVSETQVVTEALDALQAKLSTEVHAAAV